MSGFQGSKDRLTLLLGPNIADDLKLETVPTDHSKNPKALKNYAKSILPVLSLNEIKKPERKHICLQNDLLNIQIPLLI